MRQMKSPFMVDTSGEAENETENVDASSSNKLAELISERAPLSPKLGANGESNYESGEVGACRNVASSDKLAAMLSERTKAIHSIRGLLQREHRQGTKSSHHADQVYFLNRTFSSHVLLLQSTDNDLICELKNEVRMLRQDVGWKKQTNDVLEKTVNNLKTRNGDYAQQLRQLSSMVDKLVLSNNERKQRISVLEDDGLAKKIMIDDKKREIHTKNISLEEITAENVDLAERYQRSEIENLGLKVAVKALVASNEENIQQMSMLEKHVAAKKSVIDEKSMDVHKFRTTCEEMAAENAALDWQLKLSKAESDRLKAVVQDLESKNTYFASELKTYEALQAHIVRISAANDDHGEVYNANEEKNAEFVDAINSLTVSFNDERSSHEREIEEMKNTMEMETKNHAIVVRELEEDLEDVKTRITAQMAAQKESLEARIANLVKSLDEARMHRRDVSCQNEELLTKIDEVERSAAKSTEGLADAMGKLD